jgi:long-chain acyl-CoA synthetase
MKFRLIEQLERRARNNPDAYALRQVESERSMTWAQLSAQTTALADALVERVEPGGVAVICAPNEPEFTVAFLASLSAGLRAFPISPELAEPEMLAAAQRSGAAAAIGIPRAVQLLRDRVRFAATLDQVPQTCGHSRAERDHDSAGLLLLSSGTTGRPKIVFRDARSLDAVSDAMAASIGFSESDHVLACVPLCHSYGIEHGLLASLWAGSCVHLARGFELRTVVRELSESPITILPGVPFMFEMLARHGREGAKFASLRRAYSAGGPLPQSIATQFQERFGVTVSQLYGATEIGSVTYSDPDLPGFDAASVGRAMTGVSVRILSTDTQEALPPGAQGQVAVAAASMLSGCLDEPPPETAEGHFLTGDLGRLDAFGNLTVTGRIKLLIDVGGLKVNPLEVEEVLSQHAGVASCVVVPVRASETVSRLKAIVTPTPGVCAPTPESLRKHARAKLAGYKVPRVFEIRDSLPKSPTGKILRHLVQA